MSEIDEIANQIRKIGEDTNQWSSRLESDAQRCHAYASQLQRLVGGSGNADARQAIESLEAAAQSIRQAQQQLQNVRTQATTWVAKSLS